MKRFKFVGGKLLAAALIAALLSLGLLSGCGTDHTEDSPGSDSQPIVTADLPSEDTGTPPVTLTPDDGEAPQSQSDSLTTEAPDASSEGSESQSTPEASQTQPEVTTQPTDTEQPETTTKPAEATKPSESETKKPESTAKPDGEGNEIDEDLDDEELDIDIGFEEINEDEWELIYGESDSESDIDIKE